MGTGIKNGKLHTNNICRLKLILTVAILFVISGTSPVYSLDKTRVIVIDAGHGGKDPGALGSFSKEKNIVLAIALKTGEYIEKNIKNVKVLYTRDSDVFVELRDRADFANKNKADLFISIHANWGGSKSVMGTETYIMGPAKDEQNLEVAMKENEVMKLEDNYSTKYEGFDPKSPESYIMFTVMQNTFQEQSTSLAQDIEDQFRNRIHRTDRGVKQAGFWVLYMTTMPSVLVETGFITNPEEEKYLNSKEGQEYIASAIYRASSDYLYRIDKKSNISTVVQASQDNIRDTSEGKAGKPADELYFMVQVVSSAEKIEISQQNFKGITDVVEIATPKRFRYATGNFQKYSDAVEYRKKINSIYPDAFVIAVENNKILPLQDALEIKHKK